jgi:sulfatase maturation enzyme AslB (radical SAM superfamily)
MKKKRLEDINIKNIFLYITENCNLKCDYCYFKYKNRSSSSDFNTINKFLKIIEQHPKKNNIRFIISGGEPTLSWVLLKKVVCFLRENFKANRINIQTNGTMLNFKKLIFLKNYLVGTEFGIDGDLNSSMLHRKGLNDDKFRILCSNIENAVKLNLPVSATMTVHPDEISKISRNLSYLINLGLNNIDITPAAFMDWNDNCIEHFKIKYKYIIKKLSRIKKNILSIGEDMPSSNISWDIALGSNGSVLPGDVYLCLSQRKKKEFSLMDVSKKRIKYDVLDFYIKEYETILNHNDSFCHRDFIIASFHIIHKIMPPERKLNILPIADLLAFIKNSNRVLFCKD